MTEIWRDIEGYEGLYQVSNLGRVKSLDRIVIRKDGKTHFHKGRIMKPSSNGNGYMHLVLSNNNIHKDKLVHRLVAQAFIKNPDNLPQINHKDENPSNNCIDNLEWCSDEYNSNYKNHSRNLSRSIVGIQGKRIYKCDLKGTQLVGYKCVKDASIENNIKSTSICNALKGYSKSAGGFKWSYA